MVADCSPEDTSAPCAATSATSSAEQGEGDDACTFRDCEDEITRFRHLDRCRCADACFHTYRIHAHAALDPFRRASAGLTILLEGMAEKAAKHAERDPLQRASAELATLLEDLVQRADLPKTTQPYVEKVAALATTAATTAAVTATITAARAAENVAWLLSGGYATMLQTRLVQDLYGVCSTMMTKAGDMRDLCLKTASTFQHTVEEGGANRGEMVQATVVQTDVEGVLDDDAKAAVKEGTQKDRHLTPQAHANGVLQHAHSKEQDEESEAKASVVHAAADDGSENGSSYLSVGWLKGLWKSAPPPPQPGMRVRAISRVQGAPSGKTAMLISPGNVLDIEDVICEEGVWYASSTMYSRYCTHTHARARAHTHTRTYTRERTHAADGVVGVQ